MNSAKEEAYLNDLDFALEKSWELLREGKRDRNSPLHTLAVGTVDQNGKPSQRIMVLREVDRKSRLLRFNTDARVPKVADMAMADRFRCSAITPKRRYSSVCLGQLE